MSETASARQRHDASESRCRVVLHRLTLDAGKVSLLQRADLEVIRARSVREVCDAVDGACGPLYVLVDLSVGSNGPEKIYQHIEGRRATSSALIEFVACSTTRGPGAKRRAARLGLREVFVWPEGAFGQLMRRLSMLPDITLHRLAERAAVHDGITAQPGLEFEGGLVNISASGAMIECGIEHEELTGLTFEINVLDHMTEIVARVRWRERFRDADGAERLRLGVEFVDVSAPARDAISRFVRHTNVIRVGRGPPARNESGGETPTNVRVRARRGKRADFFLLRGDLQTGATLVPRRTFFVPYEIGDVLQLDILHPRVIGAIDVTIVGREMLDEGRVDGRVGWQVCLKNDATAAAPRQTASEHDLSRG